MTCTLDVVIPNVMYEALLYSLSSVYYHRLLCATLVCGVMGSHHVYLASASPYCALIVTIPTDRQIDRQPDREIDILLLARLNIV